MGSSLWWAQNVGAAFTWSSNHRKLFSFDLTTLKLSIAVVHDLWALLALDVILLKLHDIICLSHCMAVHAAMMWHPFLQLGMIGYDSIRAGSNALDAESMCESFCLIRMWGRFVLLSESALSFQGVIYAFTSWVTCLAWRMWRSWLYLFSYFNFEV